MTLTNHWWQLIWMFLFGGVSLVFIPKQDEIVLGKRETRWHWLPALILVIPLIIWAAWRPDGFGDTAAYRSSFRNAPSSLVQIWTYMTSVSKDRGYYGFIVLFKAVVSKDPIVYFLFIATVHAVCLMVVYRKYSNNYWLSIFMFVASTDYMSWMHNGIRQFVAAAVILTIIPLIVKRRYVLATLLVLLLSQIHFSAFVFLPFIFIVNGKAWNWKTILFILGIILLVVFIDTFTDFLTEAMEDTAYSGNINFFGDSDNGTNILRVLFYSVPMIMSLVFRRYIDYANDPLINVCANLSIVAAGFYILSHFSSGIIIGRLPIYFSLTNYILVPWLLKEVFNRESALILTGTFVVVYSVFFYYQMGITWRLL